jgi:hypothetical protein
VFPSVLVLVSTFAEKSLPPDSTAYSFRVFFSEHLRSIARIFGAVMVSKCPSFAMMCKSECIEELSVDTIAKTKKTKLRGL